jgi:TonB-linked SusC/RagA family outer membrane protein
VDSSLIRRSNETNVVSALAGKAPNVEVNSASGDPGSSSYIRIRGPKTITGSGQPLFVVDGTVIDNSTNTTDEPFNTPGNGALGGTTAPNRASDINPADIASVEILKGAAAAAIYGARAGQGVVLITTKKGQAGRTRYSLRSSYSFDDVNRRVPLQTRFGQGDLDSLGVPATSFALTGCQANVAPTEPGAAGLDCRATSTSWGPALAPGTPVFNHFDDLFGTGHLWSSSLSVSGGSERTLFYLSGGRDNNQGIIIGPNSRYDKTTIRANASHRVFDNLNVGLNLSYVDTRGNFVQQGSNVDGLLLGALRTPPDFNNREFLDPTTKMHRSYRFPWPSVASALDSRGYDNPFFVIYDQANSSDLARTFGNINVSYDPFEWLNFKETFGADYYTDQRLQGLPLTSSGQPSGQVTRVDYTNYELDQNLTATASHTFSPNLQGSVTLGQNLTSRSFRTNAVLGVSLVAPQPLNILNTTFYTPNDKQDLIHSESYFGQASVFLWNQLDLTAAARYDGFSSFGSSSRYHWFPKASAAWTFRNNTSPEAILSFGKLRVAYGETGSEPPVYITDQFYQVGQFVLDAGWGDQLFLNQGGQGGVIQSINKAQPNLGPERTKEFETGVDVGLFNNRADASLTLYNDRTEGVIFSQPLANSTGFQQQAANAATFRNRGIELSANYRPIIRQDLTWEIGAQWSKNDNSVLNLNGNQFVDLLSGGGFEGIVPTAFLGSQVGVARGNDFARCGRGLVIGGVDIDQACGSNAAKGALYLGEDGFPILDPTQRVISIGNPKWLGSVRSSVTWRRITVSGLLDIKHGGTIWNGTRGALTTFGTHKDTEIRGQMRTFGKDFYPGPVAGPGANKAVLLDENWFADLGGGFGPVSAQFVEPGGYTKLREISVAYSFDQPWVRNLGFTTIDVRLSGRNLHTWTKYRGIDPEANLAGATALIQGIDYFNNPQTRSFVISLGLNR